MLGEIPNLDIRPPRAPKGGVAEGECLSLLQHGSETIYTDNRIDALELVPTNHA